MGKRFKTAVSSLLTMSIVVSTWSSMAFADMLNNEEDHFDMNDWYDEEIVYAPDVKGTPTPLTMDTDAEQLTIADIQAMNNNEALIVYGDEGYVTTIYGKLYESPVHSYDELKVVINQYVDLLGLSDSNQLDPLVMNYYGPTEEDSYIEFSFRQLDDGFEVANASFKILIDADNYPIMLQSSLVPNLQTSYTGNEISSDEAEMIVSSLAMNSGISLTVFSDYTSQCVLNDAQIVSTRCYRIYTDNPFASQGADMPYLVHYVDFDGNYLKNYPTNNLVEESLAEHDNDAYFENLTATNHTFTVERNGEDFTFTVPVSYNSRDNKYYLADPSRKIILGDFYSFIYEGYLDFETSNDPEDWSDNHLITYYNYIKSYDYYKTNFNCASTDGFGMPILILTNWVDYEHNPVDNQCSMGVINGWSTFGASDANTYAYSMDVTAHEFTHAVSSNSRQGNIYYNEYGAINEGFSDIMGNLAEMKMNETDDITWALGETSGNTMRSMSDPHAYGQPLVVGDEYYSNTIALPNSGASGISDNGGVHSNDSLFSHLCYVLYEEGMSVKQLGNLFYEAIILHTPTADYDDLYAVLCAAAEICGYEEYTPVITEYWEEAGMTGDRFETVRNASNDGYARFNLTISPIEYAICSILMMYDVNTGETYYTAAMEDGTFSLCVPSDGNYQIALRVFTDPSFTEVAGDIYYAADQSGWTSNQSEIGTFSVESGLVADLADIVID